MPCKEELLGSIQPDMKLTMDFFKRIYGYEISYPGFSEVALQKLEEVGCRRARQYYLHFVANYETEREETLKKVSDWYLQSLKNDEEKVNYNRGKDVDVWALRSLQVKKFTQKRKSDLLMRLRSRAACN